MNYPNHKMSEIPDNIKFIFSSDLLESVAQIIAQQCNCTSKKSKGLATIIAKKFPYADFYSTRSSPSIPGTIKLAGNKKKGGRFVIAMFAQYDPGKSKSSGQDTIKQREAWFQKCLEKISKIKGLKSIAFPYGIGCGLAGGEWKRYKSMLLEWGETIPHIQIQIVSLDPNPFLVNETLVQQISEVSSKINNLTISQKVKLFDHLFKDIRGDVIMSSVKVIDKIISEDNLSPDEIDIYEESSEDDTDEESLESDSSNTGDKDVNWNAMSLKEYTEKFPPSGWEEFFDDLIEEKGLDDVSDFLTKEAKSYVLYPPLDKLYTAFELCPSNEVKIIILGQDPYHTPDAAMGVAFGHTAPGTMGLTPGRRNDQTKLQPSLRNIYKTLENDGYQANWESGDLSGWAVQGVFLINTALTVRKGEAGSHAQQSKTKDGPWSYFVNQLFRHLNDRCLHLVVIMWGAKAQEYDKFFTSERHFKIMAPHPAASAYNPSNTEFFDHKPFSRANKQLKKWKMEKINWNLVDEE